MIQSSALREGDNAPPIDKGKSKITDRDDTSPRAENDNPDPANENKQPRRRGHSRKKWTTRPDVSSTDPSTDSSTGDSDEESDIDRASKLRSEALFEAFSRKLRRDENPQMKKTGTKLAKSFINYIDSLESRIQQLEEKYKNEESDEESEKSSNEGDDSKSEIIFETRFYDAAPELRNGWFDQARELKANTYRSGVDPRHFIRAAFSWKKDHPSTNRVFSGKELPSAHEVDIIALRIDSPSIAVFFNRVARFTITRGDLLELNRPFPILIENFDELRIELSRLEEKQGKKASEHYIQLASKAPEDDERAIDEFRKLLDLLKTYLAPELQVFRKIQQGECTAIPFHRLWMMFGFGKTIYCPSRRGGQKIPLRLQKNNENPYVTKSRPGPQAYRVIGTTGGRPTPARVAGDYRQSTRSDEDNEITAVPPQGIRFRFSPLMVSCFYIDFNSRTFGPIVDTLVFKPYEGELEVTSLEAYPLQYHLQTAKDYPVDPLLQRGRRFIDMTIMRHLSYEGLTCGDNKEEIISPVIVDMQHAFRERVVDMPIFPNTLDDFWPRQMRQQTNEIMVTYCTHKRPCNFGACMDDAHSFYQSSLVRRIIDKEISELSDHDLEGEEPQSRLDHLKMSLENQDLLRLLPGWVHAFALRNRKWVLLDIDLLQPVLHDAGWDDLVLPTGYKDMVQAMVEKNSPTNQNLIRQSNQVPEADLVRGKGKGCIILIHGPPGVGKTSTAECVAAHTQRPLLPITCGDIGYHPDEVEKKLDKLFNLAHRWGCVLLLDEADVFLAKRNKDDVKRNGLVSVFLRILEYYPGILFLTTNRVGAIDDAFRSRLHLTLYYPRLDASKSRRVWKVNIKRMKASNADRKTIGLPEIVLDKKKILQYAEINFEALHWNGRQIRNAFQSALALAEFKLKDPKESPVITVGEFKTIATASNEFDNYLHMTHGFDEDKVAQRERMRGDYKPPLEKRLKSLPNSEESDSSDSPRVPSSDSDSDGADAPAKKSKKRGKGKKVEVPGGRKTKEDSDSADKKKKKHKRKGKAKKKAIKEDSSDSDSGDEE